MTTPRQHGKKLVCAIVHKSTCRCGLEVKEAPTKRLRGLWQSAWALLVDLDRIIKTLRLG